jgi:hypothetical protein
MKDFLYLQIRLNLGVSLSKEREKAEWYLILLLPIALCFLGLSYTQLETGEQDKDECDPDLEQWVFPNEQDS